MKLDDFPEDIRSYLIPQTKGELFYKCLGCDRTYSAETFLYVCPDCGQVLMIHDRQFERLTEIPGKTWRKIFDFRKVLKRPAFKGIYRFHEFVGPALPEESIVYLGEGNTPVVQANRLLQKKAGVRFYYKNDGQNPSASFKDRGMAGALSRVKQMIDRNPGERIIAVCASTGDTSAAAALYASYLQPSIKSAVLLPHGKVTPQQLSQPLGSGAQVFEIPGVFDDCMKVVEHLSNRYAVVLLNSKNPWRILGQESYSYEVAQDFDYEMADKVVVVPIGNAGNISAVMNGFLKFYRTGIIETLPKILGVQSEHADPVCRYYEKEKGKREFVPVTAQPSVAQAAMIGNPVSMPRVVDLVEKYNAAAGMERVFMTRVTEQSIMDWQLEANRNGHIACTQGGECLAGLVEAVKKGLVAADETAIVDSTAHTLKFSGFQDLYFDKGFSEEYGIVPDTALVNSPQLIMPKDQTCVPSQSERLSEDRFRVFLNDISDRIAEKMELTET